MTEQVIDRQYIFYDRDGNAYKVRDPEEVKRILDGGRIRFCVWERKNYAVVPKYLKRKPQRVETVETIRRVTNQTFFEV